MIRVQIFNAHLKHRIARKTVVQYVRCVMNGEGITRADVSVVFIGSRFCKKMNKQYLDHDYVTDVLSFELENVTGMEGEVYVNLDRARQQARRYKVSFSNEVARLVVHGTLHLAGYADSTSPGQKRMRNLENRYLRHWFSNVKAVE